MVFLHLGRERQEDTHFADSTGSSMAPDIGRLLDPGR
jgi:hypothetical protein